jgi:hypothetical protein
MKNQKMTQFFIYFLFSFSSLDLIINLKYLNNFCYLSAGLLIFSIYLDMGEKRHKDFILRYFEITKLAKLAV